jgi:hypothetical protein
MANKTTTPVMPEAAVPDRTKLPQPKRTIEPPLPAGTKNTNIEPDTSQSGGRPRTVQAVTEKGEQISGNIPPASFSRSIMEQLAEGAAANDTPLPASPGITTAASLGMTDPHEVQPKYTDPASQAPPPVREAPREQTKIQIGPIGEAMVSEEISVRVKPKFTGSRFIGPYRYYFTKNVVCEVPKSVREALVREDLAFAYFE